MYYAYISLAENAYEVIMTSSFVQYFKTSIYFLHMMDYHHIKFGLIWMKESKVTRGEGQNPTLPQVENVLNRPGEIGLTLSRPCFSQLMYSLDLTSLHS